MKVYYCLILSYNYNIIEYIKINLLTLYNEINN